MNANGPETRVAVLESGRLAEIFVERRREKGIVGNIYKGQVSRVLPGMQAAFVDIGTDKSAFLYVGDVRGGADDVKALFSEDDDEQKEKRNESRFDDNRGPRIEELLKPGQTVMVQVVKPPMGSKGPRVTSYISLPGRNLVFMPTVEHLGISRRISSEKERKRLKQIVEGIRKPGTGFIVRTVAEGALEAELHSDMEFLIRLWNSLLKKSETLKAPALLYNDLDLVLRLLRDQFTDDVEKIVIDNKAEYERLLKFAGAFLPDCLNKIELYDGVESIFDKYSVEVEIDRALERKVFLKSGASLVIDQGEALTSIDVNTGRFVGKRNLEETITKTNLEASKEVADQLRLRNIGGIVIVDFIDMGDEDNREKVMRVFLEAIKKDRAKTNVTRISELGLVEMTRKRTRESLKQNLAEPCFYCEGKGYLKSKVTMGYEVLRQLQRVGSTHAGDEIVVSVHPDIAELLVTVDQQFLEEIEKSLNKKIVIKACPEYHIEKYQIAVSQKNAMGT